MASFAFLCHLVKRDKWESPRSWAIKKFIPCEEQFLPRRYISDSHSCAVVFVFSSSGSDLRPIVSTSTELLPAQRPPVISSRPGPGWDDEARVLKLYVDPRLISCLAAEVQASAVYNLRLSGCSATAAVGLQLSSCCFPALAHIWAPAPSVCLQDRKSPLRPEKEKKQSELLRIMTAVCFKW